ncbi:hypothetical protein BDY21DRAFT_345507 [Lineolata rhizophorae]|uniref:Tetratricopeptide repeat domain-containing protein n=1 Tax=Lineolata rhizophorae TaxID=578093 RepID=A0A6A6NZX0_9PEZI|nr:hypothetical protein BDY21DRAFT_345507 [Lineolata rhizophorae]
MDALAFTQLPLAYDPDTKAVSSPSAPPSLAAELADLTALHKSLLALDNPSKVPPPPVPVNPRRSAQIQKLRESGNAAYRKGQHHEAVKLYGLGISMALSRPDWEPASLVREEASGLFANRAQAHMAVQQWAEGGGDAKCSVELKKVGNAKAWWRRGKCLCEMGRWEEAREWVREGLGMEGGEADLVALSKEIDAALEKRRK